MVSSLGMQFARLTQTCSRYFRRNNRGRQPAAPRSHERSNLPGGHRMLAHEIHHKLQSQREFCRLRRSAHRKRKKTVGEFAPRELKCREIESKMFNVKLSN